MNYMIRLMLAVMAATCTMECFGATQCSELSDATKGQIAAYVHDMLHYPPQITIQVKSAEFVGGTCFSKVHFQRHDNGRDIILFLSPDHRFLVRDLLDTTQPPTAPGMAVPTTPTTVDATVPLAKLLAGHFPRLGPDQAPILVTIFSDFQCPFCREQMRILREDFAPDELQVVFRHFPLPMHPWAQRAAEAAACAFEQGDQPFWSLHDAFFASQQELTVSNLRDFVDRILANQSNLDVKRFSDCFENSRRINDVETDVKFALSIGIHATPTFFVNGKRIEGVTIAADIRKIAAHDRR